MVGDIKGQFFIVVREGETRPVDWITTEFQITCEKCGEEILCGVSCGLKAVLEIHCRDCKEKE
jgi:hypothetical protein